MHQISAYHVIHPVPLVQEQLLIVCHAQELYITYIQQNYVKAHVLMDSTTQMDRIFVNHVILSALLVEMVIILIV